MFVRVISFLALALLASSCDCAVDAGEPHDAPRAGGTELDQDWRDLDPYTARIHSPRDETTLSGLVTLWHPSGGKSGEGELVHGAKHGAWTLWHENGTVRWRGTFEEGVPVGDERAYFDNGQIHFEGKLGRGLRSGIYRYWYENGQLELEAGFEDDVRNGKCRRWTRDGALDPNASGVYEDGRKVRDG